MIYVPRCAAFSFLHSSMFAKKNHVHWLYKDCSENIQPH